MVEGIHRSLFHLWRLTPLSNPKYRRKVIGCCRYPFRLSGQRGSLDWLITCSEIHWLCSWFCVTVSMVSSICAAALNVVSCPGIFSAPGSILSKVASARIPESLLAKSQTYFPDRSVNIEVLQLTLNTPSPCDREVDYLLLVSWPYGRTIHSIFILLSRSRSLEWTSNERCPY